MRRKALEIWNELRSVVFGSSSLLDALAPGIVFLAANSLAGLEAALWASLALALAFTLFRLLRRQPLAYALGGLVLSALAVLLARLFGQGQGFFLPDILSGAVLALLCLVTAAARRPLVALTSHFARRWPLAWYNHPQVRPAYTEVTLAWALFFAIRTALNILFYASGSLDLLAWYNLLSGWPATLVLLVLSYLYGTWRLRRLAGPSLQEFEAGVPPPWQGQRTGF